MIYTAQIVQQVWEKGIPVEGMSPDFLRKDACGALMIRTKYGDSKNEFGWEIDQIYPSIFGGDSNLENLRPMQWRNNRAKGADYPVYFGVVTSNGNNNIPYKAQYRINARLAEQLERRYGQ